MLSVVKVRCYFCHKNFLTKRAYFVFNKEFGYNSFCSRKCHYKSKFRGKTLICDNPTCDKKFYRAPNDILANNYCSSACAATVNNQKYPKWPKRRCAICKKEFKNRDSKYCSTKCGYLSISNYRSGRSKYTKEQLLSAIKDFYRQHQRTPAKREMPKIVDCAIHKFESWTKTIQAAGLIPNRSHDHRMYKRLLGKAKDGHKCDSVSEILVDNWFHKNKIKHSRNVPYPNTNHIADWAVSNGKVFVEYFGLANDSPRYDRAIKEKQELCKKNKIKLIEIYPKDLYPKNLLNNKLTGVKEL